LDAADWDEKYRTADHLHWPAGPNLFVADRLASATPGRGLDLAAGEGRNAVWLAEQGWKMTAVDFSAVAIERGRARSDVVDFTLADVTTWEPDGTFDLVLMAYIHLEMPELADLVNRAKGWLEPGGELFMIGHDRSNPEHGHGGPDKPEILWDLGAVRLLLDGLNIVEAQVVRRPVTIDGGDDAIALDTLVRGRRPG
jgi:SAM-dependent methyltransferase